MLAHFLALALCLMQGWAQVTPKSECTTGVHVIAVRGHGTNGGPYGLSVTTVNNITAAIPGSDHVPVKYPANKTNDYDAAQIGAGHARRYIRNYVKSCPKSKIVVQGYSQGAMAVMAALCGSQLPGQTETNQFQDKYANHIVAVVTFGDETRNKDATYNAGTCVNSAPLAARKTWECGPYTDLIRAWCDYTDPACCQGGKNMSSHYVYPDKYNSAVVDFVEQQLDATA